MISKELRKWVDLAEEYKNEKHDTVSIAELRMWKLLLCIRSQSLSIIISCFQKLPRSHQITFEAARISSAHKRRFLFVLSSINLSRDVISTHLHPPFFLKPTRLIPIRRNVLNNEHFFSHCEAFEIARESFALLIRSSLASSIKLCNRMAE